MPNVLFLLTSAYPFDKGENFIETEIPYLDKAFDKIIIIYSSKSKGPLNRYIPKNTDVLFYNANLNFFLKLTSLIYAFSPLSWNEIRHIGNNLKLKLSPGILKILFIEIIKAKKLAAFLKYHINSFKNINKIYLYSYWNDYRACAISMIKQHNHDIKAFSRAHGWDTYFERHPYNYLPMKNYMYLNLDGIFFISENGKQYTSKIFPEYSTKYFVSRLGTRNTTPLKMILSIEKINLLSCSSIISLKKIPLIIDSLILIENIRINWSHLGDGSERKNIEKYAIEKLTDRRNISFTFHGLIYNSEVLEYYKNNDVDLFINTSSTEGIPVSIMEAMSFGIPCIGTNVGGVSEIIEDNYNGFLLPANPSPEEVTSIILRFYYLSEQEKQQLRQNAYNTWEEKYNAEKNYTKFIEQILKL
ncbi:MAG: glycosyltransferase [Bacteroidia bacterium]|nr:glycosyltransferase [Bacteroidia bacterium]